MDQVARVQVLRAFAWSLSGFCLGAVASWAAGLGLAASIALTGGTWALAFVVPLALSMLSGRAAATIHNPSGRTTPSRREHSQAESLLARGLAQEAIDAFEMAIAEDPTDPTPYLRVARIYRDRLARYEDAARWFKRALTESAAPPGVAVLATRELVELYVAKLGEPARAAPLLARMADERAGTPEGAWAARELAAVKAAMLRGGTA